MPKLKTSLLASLVLSSGLSFSGTMGPACVPGSVTIPCEFKAWDVGITALYLRPVFDGDWGYLGNSEVNGRRILHDVEGDWNWGFRLEGSYHYKQGKEINVNWYHFDNDTLHSATESVRIHFNHKWDAINGEFSQHVDFGDDLDVRFHIGGQYVRIQHDVVARNNGAVFNRLTDRFRGFGGRAGVDVNYFPFNDAFSLYGNLAAALLAGQSQFTQTASEGKKNAMVPELETKLGAKYTAQTSIGQISFDAGYFWINYINAQHEEKTNRTNPPGSTILTISESDYGMQGVYVGAKLVANV